MQLSLRYETILIDRFLLLLILHGILMIATNVARTWNSSCRKFLYLINIITAKHKNMKYNGNVNHVSCKPEERSKLTDKFLGREFSFSTAI